VKKLVATILLVPSLALAQPSTYVPAPAPLPQLPSNLPSSPIVAMPAGGYAVLPMAPQSPSRGRKISGGITLAAGIGIAVIGGLLLANRPTVPGLSDPGWFDAQSTHDGETAGGIFLIGTGVVTAGIGALLLAIPDDSYGELPGSPMLTF
jgi:hypothetical protein